jgi:hypothetical protein
MADPDFVFTDGFDHYWPQVEVAAAVDVSSALAEQYNVVGSLITSTIAPLSGSTGMALYVGGTSASNVCDLYAPLPANYARSIGGITISPLAFGGGRYNGLGFKDGLQDQLYISINSVGQIEVRRGHSSNIIPNGTLLATSVETLLLGSVHYLAWDVTIHGSTGSVKIWLDNVPTSINLTGVNTSASGNNYFNSFAPVLGWGNVAAMAYDHAFCYCYSASGGSEVPPLTSPIIETQFENSDNSVTFTVGAGVLGDVGAPAYVTNSVNAPGANQLVLRKFTPSVGCTLASVGITPKATSAAAKFKAVLYADSAGSPGALTATGTEVVGATSGTSLSLPFASGQALTGGTSYWIGFITDTSLNIQQYDGTTNVGQKKANTYTSGAPNPAGTMTGSQPSWLIWGNLSAVSAKWPQEAVRFASTLSYNYSSTVGNTDLFGFPSLVTPAAAIHCVSLVAAISKSDAGARTINLVTKSGATSDNGSLGTYSPPLSLAYARSNWLNDPNTGSAWLPASVNAALGGYKIAT